MLFPGRHAVRDINNLSTIRTSRDRYYYWMDTLFVWRPEIIQTLCREVCCVRPIRIDGSQHVPRGPSSLTSCRFVPASTAAIPDRHAVWDIKDLLTIRTSRDRYYYLMNTLFVTRPEIIQTLC